MGFGVWPEVVASLIQSAVPLNALQGALPWPSLDPAPGSSVSGTKSPQRVVVGHLPALGVGRGEVGLNRETMKAAPLL